MATGLLGMEKTNDGHEEVLSLLVPCFWSFMSHYILVLLGDTESGMLFPCSWSLMTFIVMYLGLLGDLQFPSGHLCVTGSFTYNRSESLDTWTVKIVSSCAV